MKIFSAETRAKLSVAATRRTLSPETRAKQSIASMGNTHWLGLHQSEETKAKRSATLMGRPGHPQSLESRAKMSVSHWKGGHTSSARRQTAKRRFLGFNALNSWFPGCEGHHVNPNDVIYEPKKLHRSIYHNQYTGKGMVEANALAGQYLTEDWT